MGENTIHFYLLPAGTLFDVETMGHLSTSMDIAIALFARSAETSGIFSDKDIAAAQQLSIAVNAAIVSILTDPTKSKHMGMLSSDVSNFITEICIDMEFGESWKNGICEPETFGRLLETATRVSSDVAAFITPIIDAAKEQNMSIYMQF